MSQHPDQFPRSALRRCHERHMAGGQECYFTVTDGLLQVRTEQRYWLDAHRKKASRLLSLKHTDRFVDLGCGEGYLTLPLSQQAGWSLGIDFTASALRVLQDQWARNQQEMDLNVASGEHLPLSKASVDKLLCNHMLEHVLDDDAILQEIHRVVRPSGLVLIGVPLALSPQIRFLLRLRRMFFPHARQLQLERVEAGCLVTELIGKQSHIRFYSLRAVCDLLERNGFRVLRAEGVGLSMRGRLSDLLRRHRLLFKLSIAWGHLFPSMGDGVLILAERTCVTRPLNVLHVTSNLAGGGVQRLLVKSLAVLDRTCFTHQVCCVSSSGVYEGELRSLNIPYWVMRRRARFDPTVVFQMARLMRRERIDVVHTMNFTANAWGRAAAKLVGIPHIIAHERGTAWTESAAMRLVDRALYHCTDLWLANSEAAKIVLTQHIGVSADRIRVVYNGMPEPDRSLYDGSTLRERLRIGSTVPLVGTIGRLDTPKGLIFLLQAIPLVWESLPETHFVLVGDGPLRGYLESEADQLGLLKNGHVHFEGFLPNAPNLMSELDLLVHPAIRESLGNVLIEAALACLPVVASHVDGIPEVVVDGETGLLVDCTEATEHVPSPGASPLPAVVVDGRTRTLRLPLGPSPEALAISIVRLLRDPQCRSQMGEQALQRARRIFSLERYVRCLESAYCGDL